MQNKLKEVQDNWARLMSGLLKPKITQHNMPNSCKAQNGKENLIFWKYFKVLDFLSHGHEWVVSFPCLMASFLSLYKHQETRPQEHEFLPQKQLAKFFRFFQKPSPKFVL